MSIRIKDKLLAFERIYRLYNHYRSSGIGLWRYLDLILAGENLITNSCITQFNSLGKKNEGLPICIIQFPKKWIPTAGFFALFNRMMCGLYFADKIGFSPIVDNWDCCAYEEAVPINGSYNVFEYYFKPLSSISLVEALDSQSVIVTSNNNMDLIIKECNSSWYHPNNLFFDKMGYLFQKYIHLNDIVKEKMDNDIQGVLSSKNVLGIHFRGSDYSINANGHPVALTIEDYYPIIEFALQEYRFDRIFIATDDLSALKKLEARYQQITYYADVSRTEGNTSVAFLKNERINHKYLLGYEVLRDSYTLASCAGLIAGDSQVSIAARINKRSRNEKYEFCHIINHGINKNSVNWVKKYYSDVSKK